MNCHLKPQLILPTVARLVIVIKTQRYMWILPYCSIATIPHHFPGNPIAYHVYNHIMNGSVRAHGRVVMSAAGQSDLFKKPETVH
jgi:hypothetical protein